MTPIETPRLRLRAVKRSDTIAIAHHLANWDVARMLALPPWPYRLSDAETFVAILVKRNADDPALTLVITLADSDVAIGMIDLITIDGRPTLGYWLGQPHWGSGLMTEALAAMLAHAFTTREIDTIFSGMFFDNPASLAVQKKLGFKVAGESVVQCVPRRLPVRHIDTTLTRADFLSHAHESALS